METNPTVLETFLNTEGLSRIDVATMILDMLFAGVDTVSISYEYIHIYIYIFKTFRLNPCKMINVFYPLFDGKVYNLNAICWSGYCQY